MSSMGSRAPLRSTFSIRKYANNEAQHSTAQHSTAQHIGKLELRRAKLDDAQILLEWRNNLATREASHNTALVNEEEHVWWLEKILANESRKLYIAELDGIPAGTVRVDAEALGYELSWTVSPIMRNSGVGMAMVSHLAKGIPESIRAEIKMGNIASIRIAEGAGMVFEREEKAVLHYRRAACVTPNQVSK